MIKYPIVAIVTPIYNAYSETFIKAHIERLKADIKVYHDGSPPKQLVGKGYIKMNSIREIYYRFISLIKGKEDDLFAKRFRKSLIKEKIELVLAEYGTSAVKILPICKELKIPLIVHFHGGDATVYSVIEKYREDYQKVFEYAKFIIAVSDVMRNKLLQLGAPSEKLILNTYGPNEIFGDLSPTFTSEAFIGIGRFVDKKAPYYTIIAFSKVVKSNKNAKLYLAGDGPLLNTSKNLAKHLGIAENVEFLGVITPNRFKDYLSYSRAFVQHSITADNGDMEGTPLAVLEASSAGLPVISTYHAGIPEVILNKETGLLVDEHDVDGMSENMEILLNDIQYAKALGENGKRRIKENFSMKKHISILDDLISMSMKK